MVDLLVVDDCPNAAEARGLVTTVAHQLGADGVVMRTTVVRDQQQAEALRFRGSPTIMVAGVDVGTS